MVWINPFSSAMSIVSYNNYIKYATNYFSLITLIIQFKRNSHQKLHVVMHLFTVYFIEINEANYSRRIITQLQEYFWRSYHLCSITTTHALRSTHYYYYCLNLNAELISYRSQKRNRAFTIVGTYNVVQERVLSQYVLHMRKR